MSHPLAQMKAHLLAPCLPSEVNLEPIAVSKQDNLCGSRCRDFSLECLLRAIKVGNTAGVLARINYYFPSELNRSEKDAFRYAEALNHLLIQSRVFVVKDIDGDLGYYLRMDVVLKGPYERDNLENFLITVNQEIATLVQYFGYRLPIEKSFQSLTKKHLSKGLQV